MRVPAISSVQVKDDKDLSAFSRQCALFADALRGVEILDGVLLDNVAVTTTGVNISHGLGRAYRGYMLVRTYTTPTALAEVASPDVTRTLRLVASVNSTVALWVF